MSSLGDLLELMHTAHQRPMSVAATIRLWSDHALSRAALDRWTELGAKGSRATTMHVVGNGPEPATSEEIFRVWHRQPGRFWRVEEQARDRARITILSGAHWWSNAFDDGWWTNVRPDGSFADNVGGDLPRAGIQTLFDPSPIAAITSLEVVGRSTGAGRAALSARASVRVDALRVHDTFALGWPYAEELQLLVDEETGMLIREEIMLDSRPFLIWEVQDVRLGDQLDDSLFAGPTNARLPRMPDPSSLPREIRDRFRRQGSRDGE